MPPPAGGRGRIEPNRSQNLPQIVGNHPYSRQQLATILAPCAAISDQAERLRLCAASLSSRLVLDGYVNTRVFVFNDPPKSYLQVTPGRILELAVSGSDQQLNAKVRRWLLPMVGSTMHLPSLEADLQLLRQRAEIGSVRSTLSRLGSDPTKARLQVKVEPAPAKWHGDLSLRNDGSPGSGEARSTVTLLRPSLLRKGDTFLIYGELDGSDQPALGQAIASLSYTIPIGERLSLSGAFGGSRRNSIELPPPANGLSTSQWQGLGQLEWLLSEKLQQRWSVALAYSGNQATSQLDNEPLPNQLPERVRAPRNGYLRLELNGSGTGNGLGWFGQAYLLQGVAAATPATQMAELASQGIDPGQARALGGFLALGWDFLPSWKLNLRGGGQLAFDYLTEPMRFSLGSDVGLRGLPGQLISGDNGWLASAELVWTAWSRGQQALQLVPFLGAGGVSTNFSGLNYSDTVGSGGILARWLLGRHWLFDLGWVHQFSSHDNDTIWNNWLLGQGLYAKINYRF